jgi:hypothetical protein
MSPGERKKANWTVGSVLTIGLLVWGGGAWAANVKSCNERQDVEIEDARTKAVYAIESFAEWRTRAILSEQRLDALEERVGRLEELETLVREIHEAVVIP